jgi:hypothetical protein
MRNRFSAFVVILMTHYPAGEAIFYEMAISFPSLEPGWW